MREFVHADAAFILRLVNTSGWLNYIGDRNIHNEHDALQYLENGPLKSYAENGYGLWCVEVIETGMIAGMCGLVRRKGLPGPDLGFAFLPEFEGKGYALESAIAVIGLSFETIGLDRLFAVTMAENLKARRLLEKAGMNFNRTILLKDGDEELLLYECYKRVL